MTATDINNVVSLSRHTGIYFMLCQHKHQANFKILFCAFFPLREKVKKIKFKIYSVLMFLRYVGISFVSVVMVAYNACTGFRMFGALAVWRTGRYLVYVLSINDRVICVSC